ncbi:MAG: hypothetical protein CL608_32425 [Anaerolineaceae bacterium]|nr:hypothetical protein [Anaerolineaceae bacterium]
MSNVKKRNQKIIIGGVLLLFLGIAGCMVIFSVVSFIFDTGSNVESSSERSQVDDDDDSDNQDRSANPSSQDETYILDCEGYFSNYSATLEGERVYSPYNALGDGYVTFRGTLTANGWDYPMEYEGYTNTAPFDGFIEESRDQILHIAVLDNTAGNFIIYDGRPTLQAPDIWGEFDCRWN